MLIGTLAAMPATHNTTAWIALRLLAGVASALIFVVAVSSLLGHLRDHPPHLPGWGFGGVGAGIALSGLLVLALRSVADWQVAWWSSAALAAALATAAWNLRPEVPPKPSTGFPDTSVDPWFGALFAGYTLEGVGYIVAGTFLVAAIGQSSRAGSAAARGCSSDWPPYRPPHSGPDSGAVGRGPGCWAWRW